MNKKSNAEDVQAQMPETTVDTKSNDGTKKPKKKHKVLKIFAIATIHALGVGAIVGLSVALYFSQDKIEMQASYQREMESVYARAYYDLLDGANDIDVTMSKFTAASTPEKQQSLLYELWSAATLAEESLSTFEGSDEGVKTATKFVNQLGDYSLYLARKLADGKDITASEKETLQKLRPMTGVLKKALKTVQGELDEGRLFLDEDGVLSNFSAAFSEFTEPSLDYPEMIYDGPFSDSLETKEARALEKEAEITSEAGAAKITEMFPSATDVNFIGRYEGKIPTMNYSFTLDGAAAYIQLSVKGGKVINYNRAAADSASAASLKNATASAVAFAEKLGYSGLEVVWSATAQGVTFVNLAPVENGIILYPDLIKVKLSQDGAVLGLDSTHHAYNHGVRKLPAPVIGESEARNKVTLDVVGDGRLALIPQDETRETLCYEFECQEDGTYFIYIDAATGKEAEILYVVDSEQGTVLM